MTVSRASRAAVDWLVAALICLGAALPGCDYRDPGERLPPPDAGGDDAGRRDVPDGAVRCTNDDGCDDGVGCTEDYCVDGLCAHDLDHAACADPVFCNGIELCDPQAGCVPGERRECDDENPCTLDSCDEAARTCVHPPRDVDQDGEVDDHCPGGTDCDDQSAAVGALINERCEDGVDNDCDGVNDEPDCGRAPHDTCDDALVLDRAGRFGIDLHGAARDLVQGCSSTSARDVVARLVLSEPQDVDLRIHEADVITALAWADSCDPTAPVQECTNGVNPWLRRRNMPAGEYFVWIAGEMPAEVDLELELGPPTPSPTNETCGAALPLTATTLGSFADVSHDIDVGCGTAPGPDLAYRVAVPTTSDLHVQAASPSGAPISLALLASCADPPAVLRCAQGAMDATTEAILYAVPPGEYTVVAMASAGQEPDFVLDLELTAPAGPPPGELCSDPLNARLGAFTTGTFTGFQDDVAVCGGHARDVALTFELDVASDVSVLLNGQDRNLTLTPEGCGPSPETADCASDIVIRRVLRNLAAGSHSLLVESDVASVFSVGLEANPPVPLQEPTGNNVCESAVLIPPEGGVFSGSTSPLDPDFEGTEGDLSGCGVVLGKDATFRFELSANTRMIASTRGSSFDSVLRLYELAADCAGQTDPTWVPLGCVDGEGTASELEEGLTAGHYLLVVDGASAASHGAYQLDVSFWPL